MDHDPEANVSQLLQIVNELKTLLRNKPFAPLGISLIGGTSLEVTSRFQLAFGRSQMTYMYARSDRSETITYEQIAAIKQLTTDH